MTCPQCRDENWLVDEKGDAFRRNFDLETTVKAIYNAKVEFNGAESVQIQDFPKQLTTASKNEVAGNLVKAHSTTGEKPGSAGPHSTQQGSSGSSEDRLVSQSAGGNRASADLVSGGREGGGRSSGVGDNGAVDVAHAGALLATSDKRSGNLDCHSMDRGRNWSKELAPGSRVHNRSGGTFRRKARRGLGD